jgi:acyl carrier protein
MNDSLAKIVEILHGKDLGVEGAITDASVLRDLPHWDSLKTLLFLMEVEKAFAIEVPPEEIAGLRTIGDVRAKIAHGPPAA